MTQKETLQLLTAISLLYPRDKTFSPPAEEVIIAWHEMLGDISLEIAISAVKIHASESVFPPAIAEIRKQVADMLYPTLPADEAYSMLRQAARRFGGWRPIKGMQSLPPEVQEAVKTCFGSFSNFCASSDPEGVSKAQFMKIWDMRKARKQQQATLPPGVMDLIKALPKGDIC